jgi:nucleotide-binding universal stress UspA family protein
MGTTRRFERILLATDGSEASVAAVDAAISIARSLTARVRVAHVWNLEVHHRHEHRDAEVRSEAERLVDATVERLFRAGVIAEREICRADGNHVAAAIACAAKAFDADLVVIGSRGLSDWGSLTQHSVTQQMICGLDCPVLMVRASASISRSKVLLALTTGDDLESNVRAAVAVGAPEASVMVAHVAQSIFALHGFAYLDSGDETRETMANACKLLGEAGLTVQGVVSHQVSATKAVAEIATDWNADVIVTGSSRIGDIGSLFLGSVSQDLLHLAPA